MDLPEHLTPVDVYDSVLGAIWLLGDRASTGRIVEALAHHTYLAQLPPGSRRIEVEDALARMPEAMHARRSGLRRRWKLMRRGVQRLQAPVRECCGVRGHNCQCAPVW
jgi:hypothetical protein